MLKTTALLGLLLLSTLASAAVDMTEMEVTFPSRDSFRITIQATGDSLKGFTSRFSDPFEESAAVPAGFKRIENGFVYPEHSDTPSSDIDNGTYDEDPAVGVYARTFSTAGWAPGDYKMLTAAHNRPGEGSYLADSVAFGLTVTPDGEVKPTVESPIPPIQNTENLEITQGETVSIYSNNVNTFFGFFRFRDGRIVVRDHWSEDGGKTWKAGEGGPSYAAFEYPDGTVIQPGWEANFSGTPGEYEGTLLRWLPDGERETETTRVLIPEGAPQLIDDGGAVKKVTGVFDHGTLQLSDGSLISAMYGNFKTDTVQAPTFKFQFYKTRVWLVRSTDQGKTWTYYSTVAYDPRVGLESFCEPSLLQLPNKEILCFMRTGGSGGQYSPLYMARSTDEGKTWSTPAPIADRGVFPNAARTDNGVIGVVYGRPDLWVMFSVDDGKTWEGNYCYLRAGWPNAAYTGITAVDEDTFLVVYHRTGSSVTSDGKKITMGDGANEIACTFYTVKPTK